MPGIVGCADTAGFADTVGLVRIVEVADNAEAAAGTADIVAATEWQPSLTAMTWVFGSVASRELGTLPQIMKTSVETRILGSATGRFEKS